MIDFSQRILCVYPPYEIRIDYTLGLAHVMSYLRSKGFTNLSFIDAPSTLATHDDIVEFVKDNDVDVIMLGIPFASMTDSALKLLEMLKPLRKRIIVGGVMSTLMPELFKDHANVVVKGDGELASFKILCDPEFNGVMQGERLDADNLPYPAWDLYPTDEFDLTLYSEKERSMPVVASRGCPYDCNFCNNGSMSDHKVFYRKADKVVEEIKFNIQKYGISSFEVVSQNFTLDKEFVHSFCSIIISQELNIKWWCGTRASLVDDSLLREMKLSGCVGISFGVESGDEEIRNKIGKHMKDNDFSIGVKMVQNNGMYCYCSYIIGHPWDTMETIKKTALHMDMIDPDFVGVAICTPFPKTRLREEIREDQIIAKSWSDYLVTKMTFVPDGLKGRNLNYMREVITLDFYSRKLRRLKLLWKVQKKYFLLFSPTLIGLFMYHKFTRRVGLSSWLVIPFLFIKKLVKKL